MDMDTLLGVDVAIDFRGRTRPRPPRLLFAFLPFWLVGTLVCIAALNLVWFKRRRRRDLRLNWANIVRWKKRKRYAPSHHCHM
jgi:hypothetical protein